MPDTTARTDRSVIRFALLTSLIALCTSACDSNGRATDHDLASRVADRSPVAGLNLAPSISGVPPTTARVNVRYEFTPSATDPERDDLQFEISGKPRWASFDASTGRLHGTPTSAGLFSNILIVVSDGRTRAALPAFTIEVGDAALLGSATLRWIAPTETSSGDPLTDLAGFRVYYGQSYPSLDRVMSVADPHATQAVIPNLDAGTWYFTLTAYTASGTESSRSNVVSKGI